MNREELRTWAALLPAFREIRTNRCGPSPDSLLFFARASDGVELFCTIRENDPLVAVVVAHPAIVGSRYLQVQGLASELSESFSTVSFDFRGHGRSGGRCPIGFEKVAGDLGAVVDRVRLMGFDKVAVAGFSLGAAAAIMLASERPCIDALVSIGCPPRFPSIPYFEKHPRAAKLALRLLGMRLDLEADGGPSPIDVAGELPPIPKLIVFGEVEVAPPEEIEGLAESITVPKTIVTTPGTWHADLGGREKLVREWLEDNL